jgi:hypothetical protein
VSRNDEVLMLKQQIQSLKRENERLDDFCQNCLTKISETEILLRRVYNYLGMADELRNKINEVKQCLKT